MYVLMTNQPFTRRKQLHHILDHTGEVVWSGSNVGQAIEYLLEFDQTNFRLTTSPEHKQYRVSVMRAEGEDFDRDIL